MIYSILLAAINIYIRATSTDNKTNNNMKCHHEIIRIRSNRHAADRRLQASSVIAK